MYALLVQWNLQRMNTNVIFKVSIEGEKPTQMLNFMYTRMSIENVSLVKKDEKMTWNLSTEKREKKRSAQVQRTKSSTFCY